MTPADIRAILGSPVHVAHDGDTLYIYGDPSPIILPDEDDPLCEHYGFRVSAAGATLVLDRSEHTHISIDTAERLLAEWMYENNPGVLLGERAVQ